MTNVLAYLSPLVSYEQNEVLGKQHKVFLSVSLGGSLQDSITILMKTFLITSLLITLIKVTLRISFFDFTVISKGIYK